MLKRVTTPSLSGRVWGGSFILLLLSACTSSPTDPENTDALPSIYPDYIGVTIPVGIAPLNFSVEGNEDAQITVEMEADSEYEVFLNGDSAGRMTTNLGGKLSFSAELENAHQVDVKIVKC